MKVSTKGRYALRMMIDLAEHSGEWVSLKDISRRQDISTKYLEQIVTTLNKTGLVVSSRGAQGGYRLSKAPDQYTAGQILRTIEGELAPVTCLETEQNLCQRKDTCPTLGFWEGLHRRINDYVESVTLADLVRQKAQVEYDYVI